MSGLVTLVHPYVIQCLPKVFGIKINGYPGDATAKGCVFQLPVYFYGGIVANIIYAGDSAEFAARFFTLVDIRLAAKGAGRERIS